MAAIAKRIMNVVFITWVPISIVLIVQAAIQVIEYGIGTIIHDDFYGLILGFVLGYGLLFAANYVAFGSPRLWHALGPLPKA